MGNDDTQNPGKEDLTRAEAVPAGESSIAAQVPLETGEIPPAGEADLVAEVKQMTGEIQVGVKAQQATVLEAVKEYPSFTRTVASFSPESAEALKKELGMGPADLLVGLPSDVAAQFEMNHGDGVLVSMDGKTVLFPRSAIRLVTGTRKGPLTKCALSKPIRQATGLRDHRETGNDKADLVPFTLVVIDGKKALWLKAEQRTEQK